jgi:hypothetical protein
MADEEAANRASKKRARDTSSSSSEEPGPASEPSSRSTSAARGRAAFVIPKKVAPVRAAASLSDASTVPKPAAGHAPVADARPSRSHVSQAKGTEKASKKRHQAAAPSSAASALASTSSQDAAFAALPIPALRPAARPDRSPERPVMPRFFPSVYSPDEPAETARTPHINTFGSVAAAWRRTVMTTVRYQDVCPPDFVFVFDLTKPVASMHASPVRLTPQDAYSELAKLPIAAFAQYIHFIQWQDAHTNWPIIVPTPDWYLLQAYHSKDQLQALSKTQVVEIRCPLPDSDPSVWFVWQYRHPLADAVPRYTPKYKPYDYHFSFVTDCTDATPWGSIARRALPSDRVRPGQRYVSNFDLHALLPDDAPRDPSEQLRPANNEAAPLSATQDERARKLAKLVADVWAHTLATHPVYQEQYARIMYGSEGSPMFTFTGVDSVVEEFGASARYKANLKEVKEALHKQPTLYRQFNELVDATFLATHALPITKQATSTTTRAVLEDELAQARAANTKLQRTLDAWRAARAHQTQASPITSSPVHPSAPGSAAPALYLPESSTPAASWTVTTTTSTELATRLTLARAGPSSSAASAPTYEPISSDDMTVTQDDQPDAEPVASGTAVEPPSTRPKPAAAAPADADSHSSSAEGVERLLQLFPAISSATLADTIRDIVDAFTRQPSAQQPGTSADLTPAVEAPRVAERFLRMLHVAHDNYESQLLAIWAPMLAGISDAQDRHRTQEAAANADLATLRTELAAAKKADERSKTELKATLDQLAETRRQLDELRAAQAQTLRVEREQATAKLQQLQAELTTVQADRTALEAAPPTVCAGEDLLSTTAADLPARIKAHFSDSSPEHRWLHQILIRQPQLPGLPPTRQVLQTILWKLLTPAAPVADAESADEPPALVIVETEEPRPASAAENAPGPATAAPLGQGPAPRQPPAPSDQNNNAKDAAGTEPTHTD